MGPKNPVCPLCKKRAAPRSSNPSFPFCCPRCKQIDLGNWLDERYRVPAEEPAPEETPPRGNKTS